MRFKMQRNRGAISLIQIGVICFILLFWRGSLLDRVCLAFFLLIISKFVLIGYKDLFTMVEIKPDEIIFTSGFRQVRMLWSEVERIYVDTDESFIFKGLNKSFEVTTRRYRNYEELSEAIEKYGRGHFEKTISFDDMRTFRLSNYWSMIFVPLAIILAVFFPSIQILVIMMVGFLLATVMIIRLAWAPDRRVAFVYRLNWVLGLYILIGSMGFLQIIDDPLFDLNLAALLGLTGYYLCMALGKYLVQRTAIGKQLLMNVTK